MTNIRKSGVGRQTGFTLVEIMIVVSIIGMLAAIAVPAFLKSRARAKATRCVSNLRVYLDGLKQYNLDYGEYPSQLMSGLGVLPVGMDDYLDPDDFAGDTACGGQWRWMNNNVGLFAPYYLVQIVDGAYAGKSSPDVELLRQIDSMMDDGTDDGGGGYRVRGFSRATNGRASGGGDQRPR